MNNSETKNDNYEVEGIKPKLEWKKPKIVILNISNTFNGSPGNAADAYFAEGTGS